MTKRLLMLLLGCALTLAPVAARSQGFPQRIITFVVPAAAGGPTDTIARLLGESMSRTLGQQIIIENVGGAGGTVGCARVAKAAPDGYTLLVHNLALAASASLYSRLPYDAATAFSPVGLVNYGPFVLIGRKTLEADSPVSLFARMRTGAAPLSMAHGGAGSGAHLCAVLLAHSLGSKVTHVPYRGGAPALNDVLAGQVDMMCSQVMDSVPHVQAGTVKVFATTAPDRIERIPNVPTFRELGLPALNISLWTGMFAPRGTPTEIIETLNGALRKALAEPHVQRRFADLGTIIYPADQLSPASLDSLLKSEIATWAATIKAAGIEPEAQ